jgi:uncharacterized protein (DUF1684 family)
MCKRESAAAAWLIWILCFGLALLIPADFAIPSERKDLMEGRKQELSTFREKRNQFFKEDSHTPLKEIDRKTFRGLRYYPVDLNYAMIGRIERYPLEQKPLYANLPTSKGTEKKYVKYGRFKFRWMGKEYTLQIYRTLGGGELFLPFRDKTSGEETYPMGRYLHIEPLPEGRVLIDFNRAYNPFCEYNEHFTCPYAPEENWLPFEIRAGEKRFR